MRGAVTCSVPHRASSVTRTPHHPGAPHPGRIIPLSRITLVARIASALGKGHRQYSARPGSINREWSRHHQAQVAQRHTKARSLADGAGTAEPYFLVRPKSATSRGRTPGSAEAHLLRAVARAGWRGYHLPRRWLLAQVLALKPCAKDWRPAWPLSLRLPPPGGGYLFARGSQYGAEAVEIEIGELGE